MFFSTPDERTTAALPSEPSARTVTFSGATTCRESARSISPYWLTPVGRPSAPTTSIALISPPKGL